MRRETNSYECDSSFEFLQIKLNCLHKISCELSTQLTADNNKENEQWHRFIVFSLCRVYVRPLTYSTLINRIVQTTNIIFAWVRHSESGIEHRASATRFSFSFEKFAQNVARILFTAALQ